MFNLRGNCNLSGERRKIEGGNVFGEGTKTPITLTLLVKKPATSGCAKIFYKDIGDYSNRVEKLSTIKRFGSILNPEMELTSITPNEDGDWINKRSKVFETFIPIGDKKNPDTKTVFVPYYSRGVASARDVWVYNFSQPELVKNISSMIDFYNENVAIFENAKKENPSAKPDQYIRLTSSRISWNRGLKNDYEKLKRHLYRPDTFRIAMYRPFVKEHYYFDRNFNDMVYQIPRLFPTPQSKNLVICCSGNGANTFSTIITDCVPDLHILESGTQCFPLYYYEESDNSGQRTLFDNDNNNIVRRDGLSDFILQRCRQEFGYRITKEDIFFYIYGLLHSKQYRQKFSADLKKMLPRIPLVKEFWAFSKAGGELAKLHLNYENIAPTDVVKIDKHSDNYTVEKIRFPQKNKKDTIIFNPYITISNVPLRAYDYIVNGKSPIEWLMERYQLTNDSYSKIVNNPNLWCSEHGNSKYIFDLLLKLIALSISTMDIVDSLPDISDELK